MTEFEGDANSPPPGHGMPLQSQILLVMTGIGAVAPIAGLLTANNAATAEIAGLGLAVALVNGLIVTRALMRPIRELHRRLVNRSQGRRESAEESKGKFGQSSRAEDQTIFAKLWRRLSSDEVRLPRELLAIEREIDRLDRADATVSERAMQSITKDLSRHLSHQLKSPMALLRAHAESARHKVALGDDAGVTASLTAIEEVSMSVACLVEQLLSMTYLGGLENLGQMAKPVNVSSTLMQVVRVRSALGAARQVTIAPEIEAGLWLNGEPFLLGEMLAALVDNAVRHSPDNSVVHVLCRHKPDTNTVVLRVTDQGPGIPHLERERVFDPFYGALGADANGNMRYGPKLDRSLPGAAGKSHGLGLSIVRSVARLYDAQVFLEDGPQGRGLTARVVLTAVEPPGDDC
jgi:signal transduction histidine kinase